MNWKYESDHIIGIESTWLFIKNSIICQQYVHFETFWTVLKSTNTLHICVKVVLTGTYYGQVNILNIEKVSPISICKNVWIFTNEMNWEDIQLIIFGILYGVDTYLNFFGIKTKYYLRSLWKGIK